MKISVNDEIVCELSLTQKKVIQNDVNIDEFDADMKRRVNYIIMHKYDKCFERLKKEWDGKFLRLGISMIPTENDAYAELIFSQQEYKNRKQREAESILV